MGTGSLHRHAGTRGGPGTAREPLSRSTGACSLEHYPAAGRLPHGVARRHVAGSSHGGLA